MCTLVVAGGTWLGVNAPRSGADNGFHLVYAEPRDVLATVSDRGVTIVTERSFVGARRPRDGAPRTRRTAEMRWAEGPPCPTPFAAVAAALEPSAAG